MRRRRRARLFVKRAQDDRVRVGQVRKRPQARLGALRNKLRDEVRGVDGLTVRLQGGESESGRDQGRAEIDPRSGARAGDQPHLVIFLVPHGSIAKLSIYLAG